MRIGPVSVTHAGFYAVQAQRSICDRFNVGTPLSYSSTHNIEDKLLELLHRDWIARKMVCGDTTAIRLQNTYAHDFEMQTTVVHFIRTPNRVFDNSDVIIDVYDDSLTWLLR